jgi:hypothetical protein
MSESEFITGRIVDKYLSGAAPGGLAAAGKGDLPEIKCDSYVTDDCGPTKKPCDPEWYRKNPPPAWYVKMHGPGPYGLERPQKK